MERRRISSVVRALPFVVAGLLAGTAGCGGSKGVQVVPIPRPAVSASVVGVRAGSVWQPVMPPLSPNTAHTLRGASGQASASGKASLAGRARMSAYAVPPVDSWFYLVNAYGLPTPAASGLAAPPLQSPPPVLTVAAPLRPVQPNAPNGGAAVVLAQLSASTSGNQLWKAVGATGGSIYLRSAESFQTNTTTSSYTPDMLVGYGASTIDLDVGQVLGEGSSGEDITLNQAQPPMSNPNTEFQQWIYNTSNGYLTNVLTGDRFGLGKAPEWFAYPNYFIVQVALEPNSNPPFPAASATTTPYGVTDVAGEQAAYNYISYHVLLGSVSSCTLEGTTYTGIRCDYNNLSATSLLDTCASDTSSWSVNAAQLQQTNPGSYPAPAPNTTPTPISNADWAAVVVQLNMECQYAASVQTTFANYNTIFTDVFESDSATIPGLASDLDVSSNTVNVVAVDYIEGSIYTVLSAAPIPGAGALANLMEMGVNTSLAKSAALTQTVNTTAGALYTTLESTFQTALTQETNGENAILEDWGRLQQIGPLAAVDGYNGLAITAPEIPALVTSATKGYSVTVEQALLPLVYSPIVIMGYSTSTLSGVASYDQYSYETFAGFTAPYDLSFLKSPGGEVTSSYPSSQVMQNDVLDNGANQFDLFNGLNGWDFPYLVSESYGCGSVFMTLFNGTPNTLSLYAEPTGGSITSGSLLGNVQVSAQNGVYMRLQGDMQPYSYTPIVASVNSLSNSAVSITVQVFDANYSTQASVASLTFGGKSKLPGGPLVVDATNVNWIDGYSWSPMPANNAYASTGSNIKQPSSASSCGSLSSNSPGGLWATIVQ